MCTMACWSVRLVSINPCRLVSARDREWTVQLDSVDSWIHPLEVAADHPVDHPFAVAAGWVGESTDAQFDAGTEPRMQDVGDAAGCAPNH
jgi:hypothetical protein